MSVSVCNSVTEDYLNSLLELAVSRHSLRHQGNVRNSLTEEHLATSRQSRIAAATTVGTKDAAAS